MSNASRREFMRTLGGLTALSLGGCKIEPILGLPSSELVPPLLFPDLRPQIPDQLDDAETTLRAKSDQLLDRLYPLLVGGELRERPFEQHNAITQLLASLRSFGLDPAGNRGGWLLPVPLDIIEPTGAAPQVTLRPELEPSDAAPPQPLELATLGAFRQRGYALPHRNLLVSPIRDATPIASDNFSGHVALIRAPKDLDLTHRDAGARVDLLFSSAREAGAIGCLLLTNADDPTLERFRRAWQRQVRRPGSYDEALLIEGIVGAEGRAAIQAAREQSWVLDVALATRQYAFEAHDILARITGREHPDEAVVLTCAWDTPNPATIESDTLRLLASLAAFAQLADWSRRSTPPRYSLLLLLTADAGFAAGQTVHAAWASSFGTQTTALLALDRPTIGEPPPAVTLSGHFDSASAELVRSVVAADNRDLLLADQLTMPSLAPYLRYQAPVMAIGAPDPDALELRSDESQAPSDAEPNPRAGIHADVRLLRNLMLTLAARR